MILEMSYKIVEKKMLNPTVFLMEVEAPLVARKAEPGQFVILRIDEYGERVPFTVADFDREKGTITVIIQIVGKTTRDLAKLEADIELIKANIEQTELRAPFDGVIGLRGVSVGSYASPSVVVAKLTKISPVKVEFAVPERYTDDIKIGANVVFSLTGEVEQFRAKVYAKESKIDPVTHTLTVRALYDNRNGASLAGRYATVKLEKQRIDDAIVVPSDAIVPEMGVDKLFLYKSGKAQPVDVIAGLRTDKDVQIVRGINMGDTVIVSGTLQLRSGLPVVLDNVE